MSSGMRCAETTRVSCGTPNSLSRAAACCITSQSDELPMTMPTMGAAAFFFAGFTALTDFFVAISPAPVR